MTVPFDQTIDTHGGGSPAPAVDAFWAEPPARDAVFVRGADAARFIDGFQTASVAKLGLDRGTEAMFTDGRGHVLVLANILRPMHVPEGGDSSAADPPGGERAAAVQSAAATGGLLWLDLPAGTAVGLVEHLERYHIREDVEFIDVSRRVPPGLFVGGRDAAVWLAAAGRFAGRLPVEPLELAAGSLGGTPVSVLRSDRYGAGGFLIFGGSLRDWLTASGLPRADDVAVEEARILGRHPELRDIPPKTLPQELDRPAAISFTKGCYLGQETVARLDALGHVNRRLVVVAVAGATPQVPAAVLDAGGGQVGIITSAGHSTRLGCAVGLAILHVKALAAGATMSVEGRPARLVDPLSGDAAAAPAPEADPGRHASRTRTHA